MKELEDLIRLLLNLEQHYEDFCKEHECKECPLKDVGLCSAIYEFTKQADWYKARLSKTLEE